jgi:hypothetical protein
LRTRSPVFIDSSTRAPTFRTRVLMLRGHGA